MREINHQILDNTISDNIKALEGFQSLDLIITRSDGVILWSRLEDKSQSQSLGALISGIWSSTSSLADMIDTEASNNTLTFGSARSGLVIVPIILGGKKFALSAVYKDVFNPAKLKLKFRLLTKLIESDYEEKVSFLDNVDAGKKKTKNLFNNITDEEIDNLFTL